jgi:hypothetical protein
MLQVASCLAFLACCSALLRRGPLPLLVPLQPLLLLMLIC